MIASPLERVVDAKQRLTNWNRRMRLNPAYPSERNFLWYRRLKAIAGAADSTPKDSHGTAQFVAEVAQRLDELEEKFQKQRKRKCAECCEWLADGDAYATCEQCDDGPLCVSHLRWIQRPRDKEMRRMCYNCAMHITSDLRLLWLPLPEPEKFPAEYEFALKELRELQKVYRVVLRSK